MTVLQDLTSQLIQGGHVDELTLVGVLVPLLHFMWVVLNTAGCVAGHWLTGLVVTLLSGHTLLEGNVLLITAM